LNFFNRQTFLFNLVLNSIEITNISLLQEFQKRSK
jgi:hypothetical protein